METVKDKIAQATEAIKGVVSSASESLTGAADTASQKMHEAGTAAEQKAEHAAEQIKEKVGSHGTTAHETGTGMIGSHGTTGSESMMEAAKAKAHEIQESGKAAMHQAKSGMQKGEASHQAHHAMGTGTGITGSHGTMRSGSGSGLGSMMEAANAKAHEIQESGEAAMHQAKAGMEKGEASHQAKSATGMGIGQK